MAKQTGTVQLTGKLGRTIFYNYRGKPCSRSLPDHVRQSAATKSSAKEFGAISKKGKLIRRSIVPYLDIRYDGALVNRLNRALLVGQQSPQDHPLQCLQGFRFNPRTGLDDMLVHQPGFDEAGMLRLPAQPIRKAGSATHLEVRVIGIRINFADRSSTMNESSAIIDLQQSENGGLQSMNNSQRLKNGLQQSMNGGLQLMNGLQSPMGGLHLPLQVQGKGTLFIILQLKAGIQHNGKFLPSGDRRYMAADIIAVIPPTASNPLGLKPIKWSRPEAHRSAFSKHADLTEDQYSNNFSLEQSFNDEKLIAMARRLQLGKQPLAALRLPDIHQLE